MDILEIAKRRRSALLREVQRLDAFIALADNLSGGRGAAGGEHSPGMERQGPDPEAPNVLRLFPAGP